MQPLTNTVKAIEVNGRTMYTRSPSTVKIGGNGPAWRVLTTF